MVVATTACGHSCTGHLCGPNTWGPLDKQRPDSDDIFFLDGLNLQINKKSYNKYRHNIDIMTCNVIMSIFSYVIHLSIYLSIITSKPPQRCLFLVFFCHGGAFTQFLEVWLDLAWYFLRVAGPPALSQHQPTLWDCSIPIIKQYDPWSQRILIWEARYWSTGPKP